MLTTAVMVLWPPSSLFTFIRLLLKLGSCMTLHTRGREWQEYMAKGLQGEEGCPLCSCTKVFGNLWENKGTCTLELHKPSGIAVPKTGHLVFAGSTRIRACSLTYQRTFGEVLWVIKKHEKRPWWQPGRLTDHILFLSSFKYRLSFKHAVSLI